MADATKAFQETEFEVKYIKINKIYVTQVYKIGKSEITLLFGLNECTLLLIKRAQRHKFADNSSYI
jgi:hypothetical protein